MNITISNKSSKSLYEQIYDQIKTYILDGTLKSGVLYVGLQKICVLV